MTSDGGKLFQELVEFVRCLVIPAGYSSISSGHELLSTADARQREGAARRAWSLPCHFNSIE
jgi:hypothetical protein